MPRLNFGFSLALFILMSGCGMDSSDHEKKPINPKTLQELLQAHDVEVSEHGKDVTYIKPIGRFGREGVLASLEHLGKNGSVVSSYNGIELIFGVAEEARTSKGYDLCRDRSTLAQLSAMADTPNGPAYQRSFYNDMLRNYCKSGDQAASIAPSERAR